MVITAAEEELHVDDKRCKKTRASRENTGDFDAQFSDDEDVVQLGDDDILNEREEGNGTEESESEGDENFQKMKKILRDGVDVNAK
eukprot:UN15360